MNAAHHSIRSMPNNLMRTNGGHRAFQVWAIGRERWWWAMPPIVFARRRTRNGKWSSISSTWRCSTIWCMWTLCWAFHLLCIRMLHSSRSSRCTCFIWAIRRYCLQLRITLRIQKLIFGIDFAEWHSIDHSRWCGRWSLLPRFSCHHEPLHPSEGQKCLLGRCHFYDSLQIRIPRSVWLQFNARSDGFHGVRPNVVACSTATGVRRVPAFRKVHPFLTTFHPDWFHAFYSISDSHRATGCSCSCRAT